MSKHVINFMFMQKETIIGEILNISSCVHLFQICLPYSSCVIVHEINNPYELKLVLCVYFFHIILTALRLNGGFKVAHQQMC